MLPTPIDERLPRLSAHYTSRINAAVAAGRMDLVRDLANDYQDEALDLMLALGGGYTESAQIRRGRNPGVRWRVAAAPARRQTWHMAVPVLAVQPQLAVISRGCLSAEA